MDKITFKQWHPGDRVTVNGDHHNFWWSVQKQSNNREFTTIFSFGKTREVRTSRLTQYVLLYYLDMYYNGVKQ